MQTSVTKNIIKWTILAKCHIVYLHMPRRLLHHCKIATKTSHLIRRLHMQKKGQQWLTHTQQADTNFTGKHSEFLLYEKRVTPEVLLYIRQCDVLMRSFCLLTSVELIIICKLYLHSQHITIYCYLVDWTFLCRAVLLLLLFVVWW